MNMWCTKPYLFFTLLGLGVFAYAQQTTPHFLESQVVVSHKVSSTYNANLGLSSRMEHHTNDNSLPTTFLQVSHFSSFRIGNNNKISLGVLYRFSEDFENQYPNEFRLTQQFHMAFKPHVVRYTHRFRVEERFVGADLFTRFRYRFGIDFPLNGQVLDVGETYALANVESQLQLQNAQSPRYNFRALTGIGVVISSDVKLQMSLQYRLAHFSTIQTGSWFVHFGGYIKI